jgi:hypothetical protein
MRSRRFSVVKLSFIRTRQDFLRRGVVVADERYDELIVGVAGAQAAVKLIQGAP